MGGKTYKRKPYELGLDPLDRQKDQRRATGKKLLHLSNGRNENCSRGPLQRRTRAGEFEELGLQVWNEIKLKY